VCGLLPHDAIPILRTLRRRRFSGYDVVEVAPPYDTAGQSTALLAANVAYELLALTALTRRDG
jgi:agmatinase